MGRDEGTDGDGEIVVGDEAVAGEKEDTAGDDEFEMPADTMRGRTGESRLQIWFLIGASRAVVSALVLVATFALLVAFELLGPSDLQRLVTTNAVGSTFTSIIIAVVTSVTLVLTVAQLVLSQEIGSLGEKSDQLEDEIEFRRNVEEERDIPVSPAEPSAFLGTLVDSAGERAERLREAASDSDGLGDVARYAEQVSNHSRLVRSDLENAEFGSFNVLLPVLNYNYAWKIHAARSLQQRHVDSMNEEVDKRLEDLLEVLRFFAPAREYFKALYFQWEIINIARQTLYGVIPALAVSGYMILSFDAAGITGSTLGVRNQYLVVSAVYTVTFAPFAILLAYILRILTVVKRTLTLGPFILREENHAGDVRPEE